MQDGDVIFSWSGSLLVDFWCGGKCGLNQHLFKVSSKSFDKWFYYIWTKYHLNRFIAIAADMATTMGHIKRSELEKSLVLIPNETDYVEIGNLLKPIYETIIINRIENQRLATLRDTILPKLMNGEEVMIMTIDEIKKVVENNGIKISEEKRSGNNLATVLKLSNGCLINIWDSGKVSYQGKNIDSVKALFLNGENASNNNKVFVVYGHDHIARTQLEAMLRRWDLQPLILDQLVSSGQTVIEKLEEYTSQVNFGIVLATPDDMGYAKESEDKKKYRVRQNVVLELGMLLSKLGRKRVAILLSQAEDMESPSDIEGLIYIPFKDNVEEAKLSLAKEMQNNGYKLDISKL